MFLVDHRFLQAGHIFIPGRWHIDSAGFAFVETGAEYGMHMKSRVRVGYKCMIESLRQNSDNTRFLGKKQCCWWFYILFLVDDFLGQLHLASAKAMWMGLCPNLLGVFIHDITIYP